MALESRAFASVKCFFACKEKTIDFDFSRVIILGDGDKGRICCPKPPLKKPKSSLAIIRFLIGLFSVPAPPTYCQVSGGVFCFLTGMGNEQSSLDLES